MRFPVRWLAEWVELPHTDELVARLTAGGLEVDEVERRGPDLSEICVGAVLERAPHPNADRLSVCTVDIGEGETRQIVCGAPNVDAGQKVAVAVPGVRLQGKKLKKSKIRGVVSLGMICSERELDISDESEGILVLDAAAPVGACLSEVLDVGGTVLDIAITANRGDCTSMIGLAREVRAHFGSEIHVPDVSPPEAGAAADDAVHVEIEDVAGCHAYAGRVVRGVRVGPSPEWLQQKLEAAGLRPINNVVDVTNLVLLEFGQPLHAFDLDRLGGGVVKVRAAAVGEKITTLDGVERALDPGDLVIADAKRPIAVAGVIGGADSEVSAGSTNLLLESAHFLPSRVRRSARRLGLSTDASYRFERGVDRAGVVRALDRAARLIAELAGGEVAPGVVEARGDAPAAVEEIELAPERVGRLLGLELSRTVIRQELHRLGIESTETPGGQLLCAIPSHRNDLTLAADLVEEVARMVGYDQIPPMSLAGELTGASKAVPLRVADAARDAFVAEGLVETLNLPFLAPAALDALGLAADDPRRATPSVINPIVESESQMRSSLVPSLLALTRENLQRQVERVAVFEVSRVFRARGSGELPDERWSLCALVSGSDVGGLWQPREPVPPFFVAKGIALRALARLGHVASLSAGSSEPYLHPGASAELSIGKLRVALVGELHPKVANRYEISVPCALIEVDLSTAGALPITPRTYREVSRHPLVRRDLAVLLDREQAAGEVLEAIRKKAGAHLVSADVFDRYEGKGVPAGKLSLAFRLVFQRSDRTLTDAEVTKAMDGVLQMLSKRFGGEQR